MPDQRWQYINPGASVERYRCKYIESLIVLILALPASFRLPYTCMCPEAMTDKGGGARRGGAGILRTDPYRKVAQEHRVSSTNERCDPRSMLQSYHTSLSSSVVIEGTVRVSWST